MSAKPDLNRSEWSVCRALAHAKRNDLYLKLTIELGRMLADLKQRGMSPREIEDRLRDETEWAGVVLMGGLDREHRSSEGWRPAWWPVKERRDAS